LGGGLEGKVYDIGRGRVLKVSTSEGQREAQKLAAEAGLAPKVLATGAIKKDPTGRKYQIIERVKSEAIPGIGQPGRASTPLEELSEGDVRKERDAYLAALKLNSLGVAHGDLHGGNLQWDANHNRPIILDSDNAKINKAEARGEAVSLLNNIGIRLEESGLYDEADSVYAVANGSPRNFYSKAASVIEENLT
jgi:predicted Ser/Thr protein kinase